MADTLKTKPLTEELEELESSPVLKFFREYQKMNNARRQSLLKEWDQYFVAARNTKAGKRYHKMGELLKAHKIGLLQEYSIKAGEQLERGDWELKKPHGYDPLWLDQCREVRRYFEIKNLIAKKTGTDDNIKNVREALL